MLIMLAIMSLSLNAQSDGLKYAVANGDTLVFAKLIVGSFHIRGNLNSGEKVKIPLRDVDSYSTNGRIMKRLPVYINNQRTSRNGMMELVECTKGIRIYKYEYYKGYTCIDAIFSFYDRDKCIQTQTNPSIAQIYNYVDGLSMPKTKLLSSKQQN